MDEKMRQRATNQQAGVDGSLERSYLPLVGLFIYEKYALLTSSVAPECG